MRGPGDPGVGNCLTQGVGNYLIAPLGNCLTLEAFSLGNYLIADISQHYLRESSELEVLPQQIPDQRFIPGEEEWSERPLASFEGEKLREAQRIDGEGEVSAGKEG